MAMTDDELKLQMDILTSRTDQNPDMVYKTVASLNKGLNPEYFTGNNTKIVNAINFLAENSVMVSELSEAVANKVNELLLDTSSDANKLIWDNVKELMEMNTIIEGIQRILEGKQQDKILGITPDDIGKILSVSQAEDGEMMVKAIDNIIKPSQIEYKNENYPEINNVEDALNALFIKQANMIDELTWDKIMNKPEIPATLELTEEELRLLNDEGEEMSSVQLMTDEDILNIISNL